MANIQIGPDGGNVPTIKKYSYQKLLALGEGVASDEFWMKVEGYTNLKWLVQLSQLPALQREMIESYGPQGVQFNQQGRFKNAQDVSVTFKEVITGEAYKAIRKWVTNKEYLKVWFVIAGESYWSKGEKIDGNANVHSSVTAEDCWLELDGVDLSVEDGGSLVRPAGTLHCNFVNWCTSTYKTATT